MSPRTRRGFLRDSGLAAGAVAAGTGTAAAPASAQRAREKPNGLLIVLPGLRADKLGNSAKDDFDDSSPYDTPNIDELASDSLRFENATPESIGGVPSRHALLTGARTFPFRAWRRTGGLAGQPGWNPLLPRTPIGTRVLADAGVETVWITDNPWFARAGYPGVEATRDFTPGDFPAFERPTAARLSPAQARRDIDRHLIPAIERGADATDRAVRRAIELLPRLRREQPFFLAVDALDPAEAYAIPRIYDRDPALPPLDAGLFRSVVHAAFDDAAADRVAEVYADRTRQIDRAVGRLLDALGSAGLTDSTIVALTSDGGTMLGEFGALGKGAPGAHVDGHFVPLMIRDPDGRRRGDSSRYFASTHDLLPTFLGMMGVTRPGRMTGEDLSPLLEEDDLLPRPGFVIGGVSSILAGDRRWLLATGAEGEDARLYDKEVDDAADWDDDDDNYDAGDNVMRARPDQYDRIWPWVGAVAGTLPEFGPDGPIRPLREDDDEDDDGIADNDEVEGGSERDLDSADEDFDIGGSSGNEERGRATEEKGQGRRPAFGR